jgi:superfamily II DNA or RNA helicase
MSNEVKITQKDAVYLKVDAELSVLQEISEFFTFEVPGAKFTPAFRARQWDGKIHLLNIYNKELYVGLLDYLVEFCRKSEYPISVDIPEKGEILSQETLDRFLTSLQLSSQNKSIEARDYQKFAILEALRVSRSLLLSPTASGKSLIIYALIRWFLMKDKKILLIVPTVNLVSQMYSDFGDYAYFNKWVLEENVGLIVGGKEKVAEKNVVISTWQSIHKMPKLFFEHFDVVFVDEAHGASAKALTGILNKCTKTHIRIGTTGTLNGTKAHRLVLEGLFGPVVEVTTSRKLMDADQLADLKIKCLMLEYSDDEKKALKGCTYDEELNFIVTHPKRNKFLKNLTLSRTHNTLILFQFVEKHGKVLYDMIVKEAHPDRKVFFVHGGTDAETRDEIRGIVEKEKDAIIVASSGVYSTGVNIRNLVNIILSSPSKSRIKILQSIGRGLRTSAGKMSCRLYDISDDLSYKSKKNYTILHAIERIKIYAEQEFSYTIDKVPLSH